MGRNKPGVGKTTLADHLCLYYVLNDFELCYIEDSISEAESIYYPEKKQLFYFDDFLGRNYLMAIKSHEDSHIINFIKRVGKDKSKRFVLTSRTTILNQGKRLSDLFTIENVDRNEFELKISFLTNLDKAKILYNHIWFSSLSEDFIQEIYFEKRYKTIIQHLNFNPRLVSFITDTYKITNITSDKYWSYIEHTLNNPTEIWSHLFDNQLDDFSRILVCLVVFNGKSIKEIDLKEAYSYFVAKKDNLNLSLIFHDFDKNIKIIVGSLVNRNVKQNDGEVIYDLFNPSVGDFIIDRFSENIAVLQDVFNSLNTIESLKNIKSLYKSEILKGNFYKETIIELITHKIANNKIQISLDYKFYLMSIAKDNCPDNKLFYEKAQSFFKTLSFKDIQIMYISEAVQVLLWGIERKFLKEDDDKLIDFINTVLDELLDHEDYLSLSLFVNKVKLNEDGLLLEKLKKSIVEYWQDTIKSDISDSGTLSDYYEEKDESQAIQDLYDHVYSILDDYDIDFTEEEIDSICDYCDVSQIIYSNIERASQEDYETEGWGSGGSSLASESEAIDDLFERN